MILNNKQIIELNNQMAGDGGLLNPFAPYKRDGKGILSSGLQPFGYDLSIAAHWKWVEGFEGDALDPLRPDLIKWAECASDAFILKPNSWVLGRSIEYITMPPDCEGLCWTKSSYARMGVFCNITGLEPQWEGHLTIEIANLGPFPVKVYANQGIAQLFFFQGEQPTKGYEGRYMKQTGVTPTLIGE